MTALRASRSITPRFWISLGIASCVSLSSTPSAPAANGPATVRYFDQAAQIVLKHAAPDLRRDFDAIAHSGPVKVTYRVRASGALESVRVTSGDPNSVLAQTFVSAIRAAKFPALPKAVLNEQGKSWLDLDITFGASNNTRPGR